MAKAAKAIDVEISERMESKFVRDILERFENIESAKDTYMNRARKEREAMGVLYEGMAARGVPQKISKLHVKIIKGLGKLKDMLAELDVEERKIALKMAKANGGKEQLAMFKDLPEPAPAPEPEEDAAEASAEKPKRERKPKEPPGVSGADLNDVMGGEPVGTA